MVGDKMKKFVQILNGKAHWIFEHEEKPMFAPNIKIVEITNLEEQPKEGWIYEEETGTFREPTEEDNQPIKPQPSIEEQILYETQYQTTILETGGM